MVLDYKVLDFFYIAGVETLILLILSIYVILIIPHKIGIAKHPLFFLGFPYSKKSKKVKIEVDDVLYEEVTKE